MNNKRSSIILPEEILIDILRRLHFKPLFRCKCVSKELNSIISDLEFAHDYMQELNSCAKSSSFQNLCGILPPHTKRYKDPQRPKSSPNINDESPPSLYISDLEDNDYKSYILHSSNGLILCLYPQTYHPYERKKVQKLCVTNPLTKKSAELPLLPFTSYQKGFGFATRVAGHKKHAYVTYRVVCIRKKVIHKQILASISTFSSDTGTWVERELEISPEIVFDSKPFTCNGKLHWFDWSQRSTVTYDPYDNPDSFYCIDLPNSGPDCNMLDSAGMNLIHFGHENSLIFGDVEICDESDTKLLQVWRLVDEEEGEWWLEQRCVISSLWEETSLSMCRQLVSFDLSNADILCCLCGEEKSLMARELDTTDLVRVAASHVKTNVRDISHESSVVPIVLCPWSSPFFGQSTTNSSSVMGFRKIAPVWFPFH